MEHWWGGSPVWGSATGMEHWRGGSPVLAPAQVTAGTKAVLLAGSAIVFGPMTKELTASGIVSSVTTDRALTADAVVVQGGAHLQADGYVEPVGGRLYPRPYRRRPLLSHRLVPVIPDGS